MLDTTLWIAQWLLAVFFLAVGLPKVIGRGMDRWTGFEDLPRSLVVVTGVAEVAGAFALVAPSASGVGEWTTPLAGLGLAVVALMASGFHVRQGEWLPAAETGLWAALSTCVAVGRWEQVSAGPPVPVEVLGPLVAVLVPAVVLNLVLLLRRSAPGTTRTPSTLPPS